jgi:hypothetical protein
MNQPIMRRLSVFFFLVAIVTVSSCKKEYKVENRIISYYGGSSNAYILQAKYISHSGADLFVDLDIGVVGGNEIDITSIPDSAFKNKLFGNHELLIQSIERIQLSESNSYSNLMTIDMSGDWNEIDLFNLRTRAWHKTVIETLSSSSNEIALGTFERSEGAFVDTRNNGDPYHLPYEDYGKLLFEYYYRNGTTSNLYDAIEQYLEYAKNQTNHVNKNITVIVRNSPDNQNTVSINSLINTANAYGIKINLIVIGGGYNWPMYNLAAKTGGFLNVVGSTFEFASSLGTLMDKGTPMFGSIHRLLSKDVHIYRLHLNLKRTSGTWTSGATVYDNYETNLFYTDGSPRLNNYLPFYVQIP